MTDFDRTRAITGGDATTQAGRGMALEGLGRHDEADVAFAEALKDVPAGPQRTRLLWSQGFSIVRRDPGKARAAFQDVLRADPAQPQALYGLARIALDAGRDDEALGYLDRALAADPDGLEARRGRAVVLARRGDWERAGKDINYCLERDPGSAETLYAAACVASRASDALGDPRAALDAIRLLRQALGRGISRDRAAKDSDLAALRNHPDSPLAVAASSPPALSGEP